MEYRYLEPELIRAEADYWRYPGVAAAAFGEDSEEFFCTGRASADGEAPFGPDTMFTIASCSKSFTAALAMILADKGLVDPDAPVSSYLPEFQMWDPAATEKMTLRDMLCHRTGFGAHDVIWPAPFSREEMARRIRFIEPTDAYGSPEALYSNVMYALAGYVEEAVTGKSWDSLLKEYIFEPLGMTRSDGSGRVLVADPDHAEPHYVRNGEIDRVPYWNVDQAGPAASITSTLRDLTKWVRFHIAGGVAPDGKRLISEKRFAEMHAPHAAFKGIHYCLGWTMGAYRGLEYQRHTGKIEGYSSMIGYLPELKKGVVALVNLHCPSNPFFTDLFFRVTDRFLGEEPKALLREGARAPESVYHEFEPDIAGERLAPALKGVPAGFRPEQLTGVYENRGYGRITVREEAGRLLLHYRDQELPLVHYGGDSYYMEGVLADILTMRVPVRFEGHPLEEGRAHKLFAGYEEAVRDILFIHRRDG